MKTINIITPFLVLIVLLVGCNKNQDRYPGKKIIEAQNSNQLLVMPDDLAHALINEEPDVFLLDIRSEEAFNNFALPGSINISLEFWPERKEELKETLQNKSKVVLIDQNGIDSKIGAYYLEQSGINSAFILDGGLDAWFETIFLDQEGGDILDDEQLEKIRFRKAAAMFFAGMSKEIEPTQVTSPFMKKTVKVAPKKKITEDEEEEGC